MEIILKREALSNTLQNINSVVDKSTTKPILSNFVIRTIDGNDSNIEFSSEAFPFMSVRTGTVSGIDVRIFRISFSGELSYEINIPAKYGLSLWKTCIELGKEYEIDFDPNKLHEAVYDLELNLKVWNKIKWRDLF